MMIMGGMAGGQAMMFEAVSYALAFLLLVLIPRIWLYYNFQMRAMEIAAPDIRQAICAHLYGGREYRPPFRHDLGTDLQMILDLTRWRFRDFFPGFINEEERR
jgi:hypothetical protein